MSQTEDTKAIEELVSALRRLLKHVPPCGIGCNCRIARDGDNARTVLVQYGKTYGA